jgi:hypothetical protein
VNLSSDLMTKGDFAAAIKVSPGRVSQYIAEGKIFGEALAGEGRAARIRASIARQQLSKTLEPSQRFGANGSALLGPGPVADRQLLASSSDSMAPRTTPPAQRETDVDELAQLRLRRERVTTEKAEREDMLEIGRYMLTADARRQMSRAVNEAFKVMDLGLGEMAKVMAEEFGISQHDAQHALQRAFRAVRIKATTTFRDGRDGETEHVEDFTK